MKHAPSLINVLRTSGLTLVVALIIALVVLALSPTDSGQRGFGYGALVAIRWLLLLWGAVFFIGASRKE